MKFDLIERKKKEFFDIKSSPAQQIIAIFVYLFHLYFTHFHAMSSLFSYFSNCPSYLCYLIHANILIFLNKQRQSPHFHFSNKFIFFFFFCYFFQKLRRRYILPILYVIFCHLIICGFK